MASSNQHRGTNIRIALAILAAMLLSSTGALAGEVDFAREVRPILAKNCFKCHGPDDKTREAGLRLDVATSAKGPLDSGKTAIVPGDAAASELLRRLFTEDPNEQMPPPASKLTVTPAQREILKNWIAEGAEYREHWAYVAPQARPLPAVSDATWPIHGMDHYILARLDRESLGPSPPADRYSLVRRVYLDLIGVPPTPEEADAYVADAAPDAYERLVDRLLASPQYGERWARRWLDLARYADTNGYEKDRPRTIWPYRDWVIRALNADLPFDQFTVDQLAGDMLPGATIDQRTATGFHRNTMLNEEGGIDPLEFRFHAMTDRMATTGTTWLGLTLGCAQCHTHKYDPIPHRDYYRMMAMLNNADELDLDLPSPDLDAAWRANQDQAAKLLAELPANWPLADVEWSTPRPMVARELKVELLDDASLLFPVPGPERETFSLVIETGDRPADRLRLEALTHPSLPGQGPGRTPHGNFVLTEITITAASKAGVPSNDAPAGAAPASGEPIKIVRATADVEQEMFPVTAAFDGQEKTGWAVHKPGQSLNTPKSALFFFEKPIPPGTRLTITLAQEFGTGHTIGRPRLSLGMPAPSEKSPELRRQEAIDGRFAAWLAEQRKRAVRWTPLVPTAAGSNLPLLTIQPDGSIFVSGDMTKADTYTLSYALPERRITALRLDALTDERLPLHGPGRVFYEGPKGDFYLSDFSVFSDGQKQPLAAAVHDFASGNMGAPLAIDTDLQSGWSINGAQGQPHAAVFKLAEPLQASELVVKMLFERYYAAGLGRFRISATTDPVETLAAPLPAAVESLLLVADDQITVEQRAILKQEFLLSAPELAETARRIRELQGRPAYPTTMVFQERPPENPRPTTIHHRGEYLQPRDAVEPGELSCLPPLPADAPRHRLSLARWLVSAENPLTARVTVNRHWAAIFGRGIVRTEQDFGIQGELPSHPELLDYLALEFVRQGWSVKQLHRMFVTSATYRQSSRVSPDHLAKDADNRLLARGPRSRLEAELIRDSVLHSCGLLTARLGGPSVYPPQPASVTTEGAYGQLNWTVSQGADRYRRSLYTFSKRTTPFAMFLTFDGPSGEACVARRDVSNTPLQALTLLNDITFQEAAQALAKELAQTPAASPQDDPTRIARLFRRLLVRPPTTEETADLVEFYRAQRRRLAAGGLDAVALAGLPQGTPREAALDHAALTLVARVVMNLDELVTKD